MNHSMTTRLIAMLVIFTGLVARADNDAVSKLRNMYDTSISKIETDFSAERTSLKNNYSKSISLYAQRAQKEGKLELFLALKAEQDRFEKERTVSFENDDSLNSTIAMIKNTYISELEKVEINKSQNVINLTDSYRTHLDTKVKQLTIKGDIPAAMAMKQEMDNIKLGAAYKAALFAQADAKSSGNFNHNVIEYSAPELEKDAISNDTDFRIERNKLKRGNHLSVINRGSTRTIELEHSGENTTKGRAILCKGGRSPIEQENDELLNACKESNALTIDLVFETQDLNQTGPARIISFSQSGYSRNFSLCQEQDSIVLRLRTTKTGLNGTSPEVTLHSIEKRQPAHILITYRPGELRVYADGKETTVKQIEGDFSNWEPQHLILGNENKDERPWIGKIHDFSISNGFTDKAKAIELTQD